MSKSQIISATLLIAGIMFVQTSGILINEVIDQLKENFGFNSEEQTKSISMTDIITISHISECKDGDGCPIPD